MKIGLLQEDKCGILAVGRDRSNINVINDLQLKVDYEFKIRSGQMIGKSSGKTGEPGQRVTERDVTDKRDRGCVRGRRRGRGCKVG